MNDYSKKFDIGAWFAGFQASGMQPEWTELFDVLYHQGDVDIMSYDAVPHITRFISVSGTKDWQPYALVASIEEARITGQGPAIPNEFEREYHDAFQALVGIALDIFPGAADPLLVKVLLALLSFSKGQMSVATFAMLDDSEQVELLAQ